MDKFRKVLVGIPSARRAYGLLSDLTSLGALRRRIEALERRLGAPLHPNPPPTLIVRIDGERPSSAQQDGDLGSDAAYLRFENRFYDADAVRQKQAVYIPFVKDALASAGSRDVVDLGCGRGEFLTLLRSAGIRAVGVEPNADERATLVESGFEVHAGDANSFLAGRVDDSVAAAISLQVIEHVQPRYFLELVALLGRKVRTGGVVILETPNISNDLVKENFWLDLTHVRPYPQPTVHFYLQQAGFTVSAAVYSSLAPEEHRETAPERSYLDYGLIAVKQRRNPGR